MSASKAARTSARSHPPENSDPPCGPVPLYWTLLIRYAVHGDNDSVAAPVPGGNRGVRVRRAHLREGRRSQSAAAPLVLKAAPHGG
jgi:hypothetical protein